MATGETWLMIGLHGERNGSAKLKEFQVKEIVRKYNTGAYSTSRLAREYKVGFTAVSDILTGRSWKFLNLNCIYPHPNRLTVGQSFDASPMQNYIYGFIGWNDFIGIIPLDHGFAIIDAEDVESVARLSWSIVIAPKNLHYAQTYIRGGLKSGTTSMHRFLMNPSGKNFVDHKNHNGLDNRKFNIREVTNAQNQWNQRVGRKGKRYSKYKGVTYDKKNRYWIAQIRVNRKRKNLGTFTSEIEAALAYNRASLKFHGEYGCRNKIDQIDLSNTGLPSIPRPRGQATSTIEYSGRPELKIKTRGFINHGNSNERRGFNNQRET